MKFLFICGSVIDRRKYFFWKSAGLVFHPFYTIVGIVHSVQLFVTCIYDLLCEQGELLCDSASCTGMENGLYAAVLLAE